MKRRDFRKVRVGVVVLILLSLATISSVFGSSLTMPERLNVTTAGQFDQYWLEVGNPYSFEAVSDLGRGADEEFAQIARELKGRAPNPYEIAKVFATSA